MIAINHNSLSSPTPHPCHSFAVPIGDHFRYGIICGPICSPDHICGSGIICGPERSIFYRTYLPRGGGGGVLHCKGYIGMCGPKRYGFTAVLVINRVSYLHSSLQFGLVRRSYFFVMPSFFHPRIADPV